MVVRVIVVDRELTYCDALLCCHALISHITLVSILAMLLLHNALHFRLVITGNTPEQDLLVGVVSWGLG